MFELFSLYDEFVEKNRDTVETFMRWILESPPMRAALREQLFFLHDNFARDLRESLQGALPDDAEAASISAALVALLDGILVLSFVDPDPESRRLRREGLQSIMALVLGTGPRS